MPQNITGLPPANEVYGSKTKAIPINSQTLKQLSQGGTKVGYGTRGERKRVLKDEVIRQQLIESDIAPDSMISQAIGRPISPETAKIAQQFMDPMFGLSPSEAIGFAEMIQRGEPIDQAMAERFAAKGELAAKGSMGDPIKAANQAINKDVLLKEIENPDPPGRSGGSGISISLRSTSLLMA